MRLALLDDDGATLGTTHEFTRREWDRLFAYQEVALIDELRYPTTPGANT